MTTFARVVEAGSLSAGARVLGLSLPAVSRQLSALEASVGGTLLLRSPHQLVVTAAGRRYYDHCLRVLREVDAAQESVRRERAVAGTIVVTAPVTLGLSRVAPLLPALLARHPGLQVDLRVEDRAVDIVAEGVDVAVRAGLTVPDSAVLIARRLLVYERLVVAAPLYLERHGEPSAPEALAQHRVLLHIGASAAPRAWRFRRDGAEVVVPVQGPVRTNAVSAIREAALAGVGVALLPDWLVAADLAAGRLRRLLPDHDAGQVLVHAVHRADLRASARVRTLLDHLARGLARDGDAGA